MIKKYEDYMLDLKISDDYYSAFLTIEYLNEVDDTIYGVVRDFLAESNVTYGVKESVIEELCASGKDVTHYLIAEGVPHINGTDAELKFYIDFEAKPEPSIKEDGTVDFKEMNFFHMVKEGEILVTKIPATSGIVGVTVTGKEIKGRSGKDIKIKRGENTVLSENELELLAEAEGIAKLINGRVSVSRLLEVNSVGPETGNIYFSGDVHVKEHVLDNYTVSCDGDLIVDGVVEGATLKVRGDLIVGKGIMGHERSDIVVNGNLIVKFIENANVYVKGEIQTGEIINSSVLCDARIIVKGKKGLIIGGEITSKYMIEANRIGSKLGVITSINLGVDADAIRELKWLKESVQEMKLVEDKLRLTIPILESKAKENPEDLEFKALLKQYKDSLHSIRLDMESKQLRLDEILEALKKVRDGQIKINTIYPDTVVKIGNSSYFIDYALRDCIIKKSKDKVVAIGF